MKDQAAVIVALAVVLILGWIVVFPEVVRFQVGIAVLFVQMVNKARNKPLDHWSRIGRKRTKHGGKWEGRSPPEVWSVGGHIIALRSLLERDKGCDWNASDSGG